MEVQYTACDKCGTKLTRPYIEIIVNYHHPKKLSLCKDCEGLFTLWLGKHPLWETDLKKILSQQAVGDGYPSEKQITQYMAEAEAIREIEINFSKKRWTINELQEEFGEEFGINFVREYFSEYPVFLGPQFTLERLKEILERAKSF